MNVGIYTRDQVPREQYDRIARMNISKLALIDSSPALLQHAMTNAGDEDTDLLLQGRATHHATFEADYFRSTYVVWDGPVRRGKEFDAFCAKHRDQQVLTVKQHENAINVSQAVRRDEHARKLLTGGRGELTLIWTHAVPGVLANPGYMVDCKGRIDFEAEAEGGTIVDLKVTGDASPNAFMRTAWNLHYHVKAAWYLHGYEMATGKRLRYALVAAEPKPPYLVQVYWLTEEWIDLGRAKFREWLDRYAFCRARNEWPGYSDGPMDLPMPPWAMPDEDGTGLGLVINQ